MIYGQGALGIGQGGSVTGHGEQGRANKCSDVTPLNQFQFTGQSSRCEKKQGGREARRQRGRDATVKELKGGREEREEREEKEKMPERQRGQGQQNEGEKERG